MSKIERIKIWRVDVPPWAFLELVGDARVRKMSPIHVNKFHVQAKNRKEALNKAWEVVKEANYPVSKEELNVGEQPSIIECFIK